MNSRGFTLIELMVAVVIMGILALIAVPVASQMIARARATEAVVTIKTYERMQTAYYDATGELGSLETLGLELPKNGFFSYTLIEPTKPLSQLAIKGGLAVAGVGKVDLCHIPPGNPQNAHVIRVGHPAYDAHLAHGDAPAPCPGQEEEESTEQSVSPSSSSSESSDESTEALASGGGGVSVVIVATVSRPVAADCRIGDGVFSEWPPLGIWRGDLNSGSCTSYMGNNFIQ